MYNLLVTAIDDAWEQTSYELDKSRFLEYTTKSIADRFQYLTPDLIDALKGYPCLFAYEGFRDNLRVGKLTSIQEIGRVLSIEFEIEDTIPLASLDKNESILDLLDIRGWERTRTHWAIKDKDLFKTLNSIGLIDKVKIQYIDKKVKYLVKKPNDPKVTTVKGFIDKVISSNMTDTNDSEVFYRGHSDKNQYRLEPSLFRKDKYGNYLHLDNEDILYRELIVSNSSDFQPDEYTLDKLVRMQHYSLPTRLLDITSNPLIALYFACISSPDEDGEIIVFSIKRCDVKYFDSDIASCISNLARLRKKEKNAIEFNLKIDEFNKQESIKKLTHFIKEEKPYFENKIKPDDLRKILCIKGKKSNNRISSQSGAFILYGIDSVMDESGTNEIIINRITVNNKHKSQILKELDILNINESTVFPYIESSAKYISKKYKFESSAKYASKKYKLEIDYL